MKPIVENFQVINSTSTELEVELTPNDTFEVPTPF